MTYVDPGQGESTAAVGDNRLSVAPRGTGVPRPLGPDGIGQSRVGIGDDRPVGPVIVFDTYVS